MDASFCHCFLSKTMFGSQNILDKGKKTVQKSFFLNLNDMENMMERNLKKMQRKIE